MLPASIQARYCLRACVSRGFTLPELLFAMAVIVILLGIGVPAMNGMVQRYAAEVDMNNLRTALDFARSEAIVRKSRVVVCPRQSANAVQCYSGSLGGDATEADIWKRGVLVFVDRSGSAETYTSIDASDGDLLLKAYDGMENDAGFRINGSNVSGQLGFVLFHGRGGSNPVSSSFLLCLSSVSGDRSFVARTVLNVGRLRQASRDEAEEQCNVAGL